MASFLLQVMKESMSAGALTWSLTQGSMTLIPKPHKDRLIDNMAPNSPFE